MLFANAAILEPWQPDFSASGQRALGQTRLLCGDVELCNGLEGVEWRTETAPPDDEPDPTQVELCETCGITGCASGGCVLIGRLTNGLLWTTPRGLDFDERPAGLLRRTGPVFLPGETWERVQAEVGGLPALSDFPPLGAGDLLDAWLLDMPPAARKGCRGRGELVDALKSQAVASDRLEAGALARVVQGLVDELEDLGDRPIEAVLGPSDTLGLTSETIYWDQAYIPPWTGLARGDRELQLGFAEGLACRLK